jgi:hypothetical protein
VSLRLGPEHESRLQGLEPDLRAFAETIGGALGAELRRRAPGLARREGDGEGDPDAVLVALELDREPEPDPLTLSACLAAHRAYVDARGRPEATSLGALALSRLLVWAWRASLLGPAPRMTWIGPPGRRPEPEAGQVSLGARCVCEIDGRRREARAVALLSAPE